VSSRNAAGLGDEPQAIVPSVDAVDPADEYADEDQKPHPPANEDAAPTFPQADMPKARQHPREDARERVEFGLCG